MTDDKKRKYYESLVRAGVVPQELTYDLFLNKIQTEKAYSDIVYSGLKTAQKLNIVKGVPDESDFKKTLGVGSLTPVEIERVAGGQTPRVEQVGPVDAPVLPTVNDVTTPQQAPQTTPTGLPVMQDGTQMPTGGGLGQGQFEITDTAQQQQVPALPPVQQVQAQTTATGSGGVPSGVETQTGIPYVDALANAVQRGYNRGEIADYITAMGKTPDGTELKKIAEITKANDKLATSEYMKQFSEDPSIATTILSLPEIAIESIASLYRHGLARMGAGAAAGAGAGSVIPGVGTAIGAGTGALAGMSVAGLGVEVSSTILDSFRELGVDITDEKALEVAFKNPKIMGYAKNMAYSRGIPIAVFDAVSMGVAGKFLGKPASTVARKIGQIAGEAVVQGSLGAAGEASAQAISGQEFKPYEILAEGLAEIPGSVPEVGIAMIGKRKASGADTKLDVNKLAVDNPDMPADVVSEIIDVSVGTGELSSQQADEIKADFAKAQEINATIPEDIKEQGSRIAAIGIIEERNNLTAKLETVDEAFKPQIQEKIKALNQQLQELGTIGLTPEAQTFFDSNEASLTNPITTMPAEVETTFDKITNGILISDKGLHDAYQWVTGSVKATLENQALNPAEKGATLNILNGMLSDIDKANTEGQKFVEEVETASVQGRVPAVREGVAVLPEGQNPSEAKAPVPTPSITKAREVKAKQAGTNVLPSSGETIVTPEAKPVTTETTTEAVTETPTAPETQTTPQTETVETVATTDETEGQEGGQVNPALADVESTAKALEGKFQNKDNDYFEVAKSVMKELKRNTSSKDVAEAYHSAKAKPESERTAQETELITQVEQLLTPTQDAVQKQTAGQVPVQSGTTSSQEVAKGEPKAEPQSTAKESETQETGKEEVGGETPAKKTLSKEFGVSADDVNNLVEQKRKTFEGYSVDMALQELGVPQDKIKDALPAYVAEMLEGTLPTKSPTKKQKIDEDLIPEGEIKIQPIESKGKGKPAKTTAEKIDLVSDATDTKSTREYETVIHKNADSKEVVGTDSTVLIVVKDNSITETESIDAKTGQKRNVKYPDYKSVIPDTAKRKDKKNVNAKTIYDLASGIAKATKMFTGRIIPARIVIGDTEVFLSAERLKQGLEPFVRSGITDIEVSIDGYNRAVVFKGGDITSLVMPIEYKGENAGYTTVISDKQTENESKANQEKPLLEGVRDGGTEGKAGQEGSQLRPQETGKPQATTEGEVKPTTEAKPKSAMEQAREARRQAQAKAKAPTQDQRVKAREAYFKPGAIVESYGGGKDKVISYTQDPNDPTKWSVTVQGVDAQGNPVGEPRTHKTEPTDKEYKRAGVEVKADADPNAKKKAKLEELKARNKELDEEFMKSMGDLTANLNPKQVAIIAERAWNKLQEIAINADMSATAVATRIKRAIDDAIAELNAMVTATGNSALIPDKDDIANIVNAVRKLAYPKADMGKIGESDATAEGAPQIGAPIYTESQIDIARRKIKKLKEGKMEPDTKESLLAKARRGVAMIRQAVDSPRAMLNYAESKLEALTGFKASRDIPIGRAMEQMRNRARQKALPYFERLSDALTPIKDNIEDFEDYLIYRRIIDRNVQDQKNKAGKPGVDEGQPGIVPAKGAPVGTEAKPETETGEKASRATGGMTIIDADIALNDMAQRLGEDKMEAFREAGDKIQEIMDDNLRDMVDAGILTQERYEAIKEQNEFYVPFDVVHRDFQGNILSGKAVDGVLQPSGKVLEKIKGIPAPKTLKGIDDAIDVYHSLMKSEDIDADQFYFLSMEYLNKALSSGMITQAEYEAKVDALSEPGFELNSPLNKISKILASAQYSVVRQEYMQDIDKMVEADKDNVFFLKLEDNVGAPEGYEVISYYKNGEKVRVAVDKTMKEAIDGATPVERNIIQKFIADGLNKIATPFKLSATALSTSFLPANFIIDVMRTLSSHAGLFSGATTTERVLSPIQIPVMYAEAIATSMIGNITMSPLGKKLGIDKYTPRLFMDWYNSGSYSEGSFLGTISEDVDGIISPESAKEKQFMKEMTKNMKLVFNEDRAKEVAKALKDTKKASRITAKSIMDVMLLTGKIMENSHKIYGHAKLSGTELGTRMGLDRYMGGIIDKATNRNTLLTQAQKERAVERVNDEVLNMVGSPNFAEVPPFMRSLGLFFPFIGAAAKGNMTDLTRLFAQEGGKKAGRKAMAYAVRNATMFVAPAFMTALYHGLLDDDDEEKKFYDEIDEKTKVRNQIYTVERENPDGTKYFDAVTMPLRSIPVVMNSIGEGMGRSMAMAIKDTLSAKELASISKDAIFNSMSEMSVINFSDKASYTGERDAVTGEKITRRQDEEWINRTGSLMSGLNPILKWGIESVANKSLYGKYNLVPNKLKGLQMAIINEDIDPATNKPYSPSELYTRFTPDYAIELSKNFEKMGVRITPITIDNFFDTFLASAPERLDVNPVDALKQRLIWSEKKKRYEAQSGVSNKGQTTNP